jgi:S1-C subfamily serine protease
MIQAQLPLNPGNSGGGLYDEAGVLIGINTLTTAKHTSEGIGFAIAIFDLIPLLEDEASLVLHKHRLAPEEAPGSG